jgi:hypothetical protein
MASMFLPSSSQMNQQNQSEQPQRTLTQALIRDRIKWSNQKTQYFLQRAIEFQMNISNKKLTSVRDREKISDEARKNWSIVCQDVMKWSNEAWPINIDEQSHVIRAFSQKHDKLMNSQIDKLVFEVFTELSNKDPTLVCSKPKWREKKGAHFKGLDSLVELETKVTPDKMVEIYKRYVSSFNSMHLVYLTKYV